MSEKEPPPTLELHQAIFGSLERTGHGLLGASREIPRLDLQTLAQLTVQAEDRRLTERAVSFSQLPGGDYAIDTRPLGRNTGLSPASYMPAVVRGTGRLGSRFRALRSLVNQILVEQPQLHADSKVRFRGTDGLITPMGEIYPELRDWECC